MFATLFDEQTAPQRPGRVRKRRESDARYRYTRRIKGGAWQSRVWLSAHECQLNLGLFSRNEHGEVSAERLAARASREFVRFYSPHQPGHGLRETIEYLKTKEYIPQSVLPPRVEKVGNDYIGRVQKRGRLLETSVFADPWDAHDAMCELLDREFPPKPTPAALARKREQRRADLLTLADFFTTRPARHGERCGANASLNGKLGEGGDTLHGLSLFLS